MSVNSVSGGLQASYGLLSTNNSPTAKPAKTFSTADVSQTTGTAVEGTADADELQSTFEQTLRQGGATAETSTGGSSGSPGGRPSPGIALYQRISQYGNDEPSTSALLKSWNHIMQGGQDADGAVATFAKTLAQNETLGFESGVLDLTA